MSLVASLKRRWQTFRNDPPGTRFQERYRRHRAHRQSAAARLAIFVGGVVLLAAGVFFMLVPGPGIPIAAAGAAMMASESLRVARALDWLELRARRIWRSVRA
jgi:hypothetical protein